jgi:hypothetical protein
MGSLGYKLDGGKKLSMTVELGWSWGRNNNAAFYDPSLKYSHGKLFDISDDLSVSAAAYYFMPLSKRSYSNDSLGTLAVQLSTGYSTGPWSFGYYLRPYAYFNKFQESAAAVHVVDVSGNFLRVDSDATFNRAFKLRNNFSIGYEINNTLSLSNTIRLENAADYDNQWSTSGLIASELGIALSKKVSLGVGIVIPVRDQNLSKVSNSSTSVYTGLAVPL